MKPFIHHIPALLCMIFCVGACNKNASQNTKHQPAETQFFTSLDAAAVKAKTDMLEALRVSPQLNPNSSPEQLEATEARSGIGHFSIGFDRLIAADSGAVLSTISSASGLTTIPFYGNGRVQAIASVHQDEKGFAITQLFNGEITDDLSLLYSMLGNNPADIRIYEVENLNARIYEVARGDSIAYYTRYNNRFDLRRETSLSTLLPYLREEAVAFRQKYGEMLKKEKLVD